jgi:hypothetical protein
MPASTKERDRNRVQFCSNISSEPENMGVRHMDRSRFPEEAGRAGRHLGYTRL